MRGVVDAIGVTKSTVHTWLKQGQLRGTHLGAYMLWRIPLTVEQIGTLRTQADQVRQRIRPRRTPQDSHAPQGAAGGDADSAVSCYTPYHLPEHNACPEPLAAGQARGRSASGASHLLSRPAERRADATSGRGIARE